MRKKSTSRRILGAGAGLGLGLAACLVATTEARAQTTESAMPVLKGRWRLDADVYGRAEDWTTPMGWGGRASTESSWVQVAAGVTERFDLQIGWQAYHKSEVDGVEAEGVGDVFLACKWRIAGDEAEGAAWALMPYVKLPTADGRFSDDTADVGTSLIFGCPWGEAGYFNAQAGWDDYGDGAGGRDRGASASAAAGRYLGERWTAYAEALAGLYPLNGDDDALAASVGGGVTWSGDAAGSWGADLAAYGAATRAAPDLLAVFRIWVEWGVAATDAE